MKLNIKNNIPFLMIAIGVFLFAAPVFAQEYYDNGDAGFSDNGGATYYDNGGDGSYYDNGGSSYYDNTEPTYYDNGGGSSYYDNSVEPTYYDNGWGSENDNGGYGQTTYYDNGYSSGNSSGYPLSAYSPSPLSNDYCYGCIGPTNSSYGVGGTQGYGGGGYGNGWGVMYSNYGYAPVYGYGGTQYASAGYPMYQYPQHYQQPMYYTQPTQNNGYNYTLSWGNIMMGPVLYSKSIGTSVPLYGTYPSCTIYFLPGDTDYMRGLKWSGINISQAMLSGYGQVTGEGFMQVPYNGTAYMLTVWNSKGEMTTCSTR